MELIASSSCSTNEILTVIENEIVKKDDLLQTIAVSCYERKLTETALVLLVSAYQINVQNSLTVYYLASILSETGRADAALSLLEQLEEKDVKIYELIAMIKEAQHESE